MIPVFSLLLKLQLQAVNGIYSLVLQLDITQNVKEKFALTLELSDSFSTGEPDLGLHYALESYKYAQVLK
nr:hypothetical protein [Bacteroidota bacterium]